MTGSPFFALGSTYHGIFNGCLVDSVTFSASQGTDPIKVSFNIVALQIKQESAFDIKALQSQIIQPSQMMAVRRIWYGRNFQMIPTSKTVSGNFGMPDANSSIFATGVNMPGNIDKINKIEISIQNGLEAIHTTKSHNIANHRARLEENLFPAGYTMRGNRTISGTIEWFGSANPITFMERILGPGSVQNRSSFDINMGAMTISVNNPTWDLSEKSIEPHEHPVRRANFTALSDGGLIVPQYK